MERIHDQSDFSAALLDPAAMPRGLTTVRGEADPLRFAVYRNNVTVALIKAIEGRFPITRRIVGDGFFRAMAHAFIIEHKPNSPLMFMYGDELPGFVASFAPAKQLPYLPDIARLEAAWTDAYHAAEAATVDAQYLGAIAQEDLPQCIFEAHPSATLLICDYPAGSIWAANQLQQSEPVRLRGAEAVLVVRPNVEVRVHILPPQDAVFAERLFAGGGLGDAAQEALSRNELFDFGTALLGLLSLGAFSAIHPGGRRE